MADMTFNCPHCDATLEAPDDMYGSTINCPACNRELTVPKGKLTFQKPLPAAAPAVPAVAPETSPIVAAAMPKSRQPDGKQRKGYRGHGCGPRAYLIALGVIVVVVVTCIRSTPSARTFRQGRAYYIWRDGTNAVAGKGDSVSLVMYSKPNPKIPVDVFRARCLLRAIDENTREEAVVRTSVTSVRGKKDNRFFAGIFGMAKLVKYELKGSVFTSETKLSPNSDGKYTTYKFKGQGVMTVFLIRIPDDVKEDPEPISNVVQIPVVFEE